MTGELSRAGWRKSSYSNGQNGACVELAHLDNAGAIRDSKNPTAGLILAVDLGEFLAAVKAGRFDR